MEVRTRSSFRTRRAPKLLLSVLRYSARRERVMKAGQIWPAGHSFLEPG